MSKEKLVTVCVNLVAVSGRPISMMEDLGFQMIIDPLIKALEPNAAINCQNVRQEVSKVASDRRALISEAVKWKFLCLKFDCCTRLARLLELRDFITEIKNFHPDLKISEIQWTGIQEICSVLEPARKASVKLQKKQLTIGDFSKLWTTCKMEVEKINTVFSKVFNAALQTREKLLMDNDVFRSGIYLDPRFKVYQNYYFPARAKHNKNFFSY